MGFSGVVIADEDDSSGGVRYREIYCKPARRSFLIVLCKWMPFFGRWLT